MNFTTSIVTLIIQYLRSGNFTLSNSEVNINDNEHIKRVFITKNFQPKLSPVFHFLPFVMFFMKTWNTFFYKNSLYRFYKNHRNKHGILFKKYFLKIVPQKFMHFSRINKKSWNFIHVNFCPEFLLKF